MNADAGSRAVVALGGNAVVEDATAPYGEQVETVRDTVARLAALDADLVLTHGNGPQVGNRLLEAERTDETPDLPLDALVAETQAHLGYLLQRALDGALGTQFHTLVTQVVVDPEDPAFDDPDKPVGPRYTEVEAAEKPFETARVGDGERPFRRVVPSPRPERVVEREAVRALVDAGRGVVCGGGGGVPVAAADEGYEGVAAVVDKDYTSRRLADSVGAETLVFLTDVEGVYLDYPADDAPVRTASPETLREHHERGAFPPGSMGPKVEACCAFAEGGGRAVVCRPADLDAALAGEAGTTVA